MPVPCVSLNSFYYILRVDNVRRTSGYFFYRKLYNGGNVSTIWQNKTHIYTILTTNLYDKSQTKIPCGLVWYYLHYNIQKVVVICLIIPTIFPFDAGTSIKKYQDIWRTLYLHNYCINEMFFHCNRFNLHILLLFYSFCIKKIECKLCIRHTFPPFIFSYEICIYKKLYINIFINMRQAATNMKAKSNTIYYHEPNTIIMLS